ncbi:Vacuolar protein sorting-associated protein 70 [Rhodosporidiobolus nylandii]
MSSEKLLLGGDSKHPLPLPSTTPPRPTRSRLPRWLTALLALASVGALYIRYASSRPHHEHHDRTAVAAYGHHLGLFGGCPHGQLAHGGRKHFSRDEVEHAVLTIPTGAGARNASFSYTEHTHVAGSPRDKHVALLLKEQWESLLGLEASGKERVFDAGTDEDYEALTGEKRGHKGRKHHQRKHRHGSKLVRKARKLLCRAGIPPRVWTSAYYPLLNTAVRSSISYTPRGATEASWRAKLREEVYDLDPASKEDLPVWHGFSANGTAEGKLVYASKCSPADFEELEAKGVDVRDKIVICQYGSLFRGLKVKAAAEAGAKGVIIYTDPVEDGEVVVENGYEEYPKGPARAPSSIQRGSVQYLSLYPGDPLTPGVPSYNPTLPDSPPRLPRTSPDVNIPPIPSLPLSYEDAAPLLKLLNGRGVRLQGGREGKPKGWKEGGLGDRGVEYFTGPSEGRVELVNHVKENVTAIWNTYALIPGKLEDEIVVMGGHHDAWSAGAGDPSSGTASVHEIVKALGSLVKQGWRPLRSILVVGWDGEEYGLLGSTEFGEDYSSWLQERVVAYLNVDVSVSGTDYKLASSPSLAGLLRDVSARVPDPDSKIPNATLASSYAPKDGGELRVGALGSGSDFTVFLQRLGIASANAGFARGPKDPVYHYHSIYDSFYWQSHFGNPTFERHAAISKLWGLATVKLANEPVLPINITAYAEELGNYVQQIATLPGASSLDLTHLYTLTLALHSSASDLHAYAARLVHRLGQDGLGRKEKVRLLKELRGVNAKLRGFERGFLGDEKGLKGREWYRHLGVAPGRWLGYGATTLPGLTEALALDHDVNQAQVEVERLEKAFERMLKRLRK